jgi:hypothetical protein
MPEAREVFADFNRLEERPGLGLSVLLGPEDLDPELTTLSEGQQIMLVEPDSLCAPAAAKSVMSGGRRYWYGVLRSRNDIRNIQPQATANR